MITQRIKIRDTEYLATVDENSKMQHPNMKAKLLSLARASDRKVIWKSKVN